MVSVTLTPEEIESAEFGIIEVCDPSGKRLGFMSARLYPADLDEVVRGGMEQIEKLKTDPSSVKLVEGHKVMEQMRKAFDK